MFDVDLIVLNKVVVYIRREIGAARGSAEEGEKAAGRVVEQSWVIAPMLMRLYTIVLLVLASLRVNAASVTGVIIASEAVSSPAVNVAAVAEPLGVVGRTD